MIVFDTHAWLWWMTGDARLPSRLRRRIETSEVGVCSVSCFEIAFSSAAGASFSIAMCARGSNLRLLATG